MHDLIELLRNEPVELGDAGIDHEFRVFGDDHRPLHDLLDELADDDPWPIPSGFRHGPCALLE